MVGCGGMHLSSELHKEAQIGGSQSIKKNPISKITDAGCEGNPDATSVTTLNTRVDFWADLAGQEGVPFLPHHSMCVPPEAVHLVKEDDHPQ
jgi:hypothetical protein